MSSTDNGTISAKRARAGKGGEPQNQGYLGNRSIWEPAGILLLFTALFLMTTAGSHLFGKAFFQEEDPSNLWGNASDWFSGVVGVSIGVAGSAIAIWLAYRVEKLTLAQNRIANAQAWRESYIDSGEVEVRAQLASQACGYVQKIYSSIVEMEKLDAEYSYEEEKQEELERNEGRTEITRFGEDYLPDIEEEYISDQSAEIMLKYREAIEHRQEELFSAIKDLAALVPNLQREGDSTERSMALPSAELKKMAESYLKCEETMGERYHRIARRIVQMDQSEIQMSDAVYLFLSNTISKPAVMGTAYFRSVDERPTEFGEFFWETDSTSVGNALQKFSKYLPRTNFVTHEETYTISWIEALCDYVVDEVNPYRYARDIIENDLLRHDFDAWQKKRFASTIKLMISNILPKSHYISEIFPENGFDSRAKVVITKTDNSEKRVVPKGRPNLRLKPRGRDIAAK
ncbi:hypothetical protein [Sulfitobacter dubius]|uniref:hypothetical protein n=1 Tax=Sulfitobacter dubius TaxID=218673 RepID=UPI000B804765|nr:hypothetical protein [Sulfitobacter dubius]